MKIMNFCLILLIISTIFPGSADIPQANFTEKVFFSDHLPTTVFFYDTSINQPTHWSWDFGDNSYSSTQNPIHEYRTEQNFTIILNVSNADGIQFCYKIFSFRSIT